jgi:hypothetical protein
VPSVLFHVVESTYNPLTVTAEVASSSLVVPAILFANVYAAIILLRAMTTAVQCGFEVSGQKIAAHYAIE